MVKGIGVDVVEIGRVAAAWRRRPGRFAARVFGPQELEYCLARKHPASSLAARFAAKEAVMKALGLGLGRCRWQDIEISMASGRGPEVVLRGAARERAENQGITRVVVSLSHSREQAVALAVAEGEVKA
ncbi:MAG: holo-ACP synthase [Clostridia bacterium]|nr:MAG: holo-ACP synthase [Clostridia bacterium]